MKSEWRREACDVLERYDGRLSRAVLRGLGGSNARPATRLLEKWHRHVRVLWSDRDAVAD